MVTFPRRSAAWVLASVALLAADFAPAAEEPAPGPRAAEPRFVWAKDHFINLDQVQYVRYEDGPTLKASVFFVGQREPLKLDGDAAAQLVAVLQGASKAGATASKPRAIPGALTVADALTVPPPAESPRLEGKRVAVVVHAAHAVTIETPSVERALNREFVGALKTIKDIDLISPEKVWVWMEGHPTWTDPSDIARAFEAEYVLYLELESFRTKPPGDLNVLHGQAIIHIKVLSRDGRPVYDAEQETEYPRRGSILVDGNNRRIAEFGKQFLQIVATECSWHFVGHSVQESVDGH